MTAAQLRELARGHRRAGRAATAAELERQAAALDGRSTPPPAKGATVKPKKTKKPKARKKKKPAVARAANPAPKRKRKRAKRKAPAARKANPAPRRKRKRAKRKAPARAANPAPKRRKRRKAKRKSPARTASAAPRRKRRKARRAGAKRGGVRVGRKAKRTRGKRRSRRTTVTVRTSNPSGSWLSVAITTGGVASGILGAILLDRFVATRLSATEITEVEGDGGKQAGAQGRDAMRRIMQKPGAARILSVLAMSGFSIGISAALGKKYALASDYFMGYGAGSFGYITAMAVLTRLLPMLPGKVVDGPEVTWQGRLIPEYQDVPQAELAAYLADANHPPQVIDATTNRMDASERYDRNGMPFNLEIDHADANSTGGSDSASKATIDAAGKTFTVSGAGDLAARRGASADLDQSRVMSARRAAQARARVYNEKYGAPTLGCCGSCKAGKECESGCKDHQHGAGGGEPTTFTAPRGGPPGIKVVDRTGQGGSAAPPAMTERPSENTGIKALPPGGGTFSDVPRSDTTRATGYVPFNVAPAPTREAAVLLSRTRGGWGNTAPPPPRTTGRYPGRRAA